MGKPDRKPHGELIVDLVGHRRRKVGDALQRDFLPHVAARIILVAPKTDRLRGIHVGGEGELRPRRIDGDPGQRRDQHRHIDRPAQTGQVHGGGGGATAAARDRIVLEIEEVVAVMGRRIELGTDIHHPGHQLQRGLATLELGKRRRVVVHRIDTAGIGGNGVAQRHGLGVAHGQVLGKLRLAFHCPEQGHPGNRARKRRKSHFHGLSACALSGLEAFDIQGHGEPQ